MELDLLDLYRSASEWTGMKVAGAVTELDAPTLCDGWTVRMLMNHILETQRYFIGTAQGEDASPPSPTPPEIMSDDPVADFERARREALRTFAEPGVIERTGPALGIAFSDQLLHGWDLAARPPLKTQRCPSVYRKRRIRLSTDASATTNEKGCSSLRLLLHQIRLHRTSSSATPGVILSLRHRSARQRKDTTSTPLTAEGRS
jgi:hypothetical protein